jgi:hypothetical protein
MSSFLVLIVLAGILVVGSLWIIVVWILSDAPRKRKPRDAPEE